MFFIHTLRMVADLSVYFFVAELITISLGGTSRFAHFVLLCICYGLGASALARGKNTLFALLPLAVILLPGASFVALALPVGYTVYLLYTGGTAPTWDRQSELFSLSLKIFPVASIFACFMGKYKILVQYSLPMAFISLATSVFLMRMLRQPPAVYMDRAFQCRNLLLFAGVVCGGWLFSRDFMFALMAQGMKFVYMQAIYPVFSLFTWLFMALLKLLMYIFSWFKLGEIKFTENHLAGGEMGMNFKDAVITGDHFVASENILTALAVLALLVCAFYFFRWMALHKGVDSASIDGLETLRRKDGTRHRKERATTTALQIRRQYRIFLKLYRQKGGKMEKSSTSQDVQTWADTLFAHNSAHMLAEMRGIYIAARYGGKATKADLRRMKQINRQLGDDN